MRDAADTDKENVTVTTEHCFIGVCFIPLNGSGQTFFGFSEFLTGLALMVLAWTIADVRYRFRIQVAPPTAGHELLRRRCHWPTHPAD